MINKKEIEKEIKKIVGGRYSCNKDDIILMLENLIYEIIEG